MRYDGHRKLWALAALLLSLLEVSNGSIASASTFPRDFGVRMSPSVAFSDHTARSTAASVISVLEMRGGASKRKSTSAAKTVTGKKKLSKGKEDVESPMADLMAFLMTVPTFTRIYLYGMVFITVLGNLIGEERAHAIFSLDPMRVLFGMEIWRPLTAACFLGKPSMQWVTSLYSVFKYGSQLERSYKGAQFLVFLATTLFLSSMLSTVLGQPFIAQAVITSMLHVLARTTPNETVVWYVMKVPHFTLPYLNALTDCFNAQGSLAAMIPHIIGILAGHFYFFHKVLWPKMERGEDWLIAPDFLVEVVDGKDVTNKDKKKNKRKSGGRKLGSIAGTA